MLRPELQPCSGDLIFQVLEVCVLNRPCSTFNPALLANDSTYVDCVNFGKEEAFDKAGPGAVYLFGTTHAGNSVCVRVNGFQPWFYIELTTKVSLSVLDQFARELARRGVSMSLERVMKKRLYGWVPASPSDVHTVREFEFARASFPTVAAMNYVNRVIQQHNSREAMAKPFQSLMALNGVTIDVSEHKVQASEKFLALRSLKASGWVRIPAGQYPAAPPLERCTVAQLEVVCNINSLFCHDIDHVAPVVIAGVDIEVQSGDFRSFPQATNDCDPITYIGTTFWVYGEKEPRSRVMQVLGQCDPVEGMTVQSFDTELDLLLAWRDLIVLHGDPDKVVSYNGTGFDYKYIYDRFVKLSKGRTHSRFMHLGRLLCLTERLDCRELTSAAMGQNDIACFTMKGRWQMDVFQYVKTNYKLSSYKLDDVCLHFLPHKMHKLVLDFPGWVCSLLATVKARVTTLLTEVTADDPYLLDERQVARVMTLLDEVLAAAIRVDSQGGASDGHSHIDLVERDIVTALVDEGEAADSGEEAETKWLAVHRLLSTFQDQLLNLLQQLPDYVKTEAFKKEKVERELCDTVLRPALDATGSDNYKKLFRLYTWSPAARAEIAKYCQVDCDLVLFLLDRISVIPNTVQMSQVTNTLLNDIANRGQQIKTFNLIARYAYLGGYVMNYRDVGWDASEVYEGATVLPPQPGYYRQPVATLDFASLYPSIMQAYNLCFSSIVLDPEYVDLPGAQYARYPIGSKTWVFQEHHRGLLPAILADLVAARRKCKKDMAKFEKGSLDYKLADGKQLALKISCNSVYGFTGAMATGMFPCMPVAVATTFNGRNLISQTKAYVEQHYGATVIYGDTDSVMVQFPGVTQVSDAFRLAEDAASRISATFRDVVQLEFEKVYCPYLLRKKKQYAGIKYEGDPTDPPSLDAKGLALVRRDNCKLVRDTMREVLMHAMKHCDPMAAYETVKRQVNRLVERQVDLSELEISNFLRKDLKDDNHPHIQVVKNMTQRGAFGIPRVGDRVPYCILEGRSDKVFERAEHPKYIVEAKLKVDLDYYLRRQLQQRLEKVLELLPIPDVNKLFDDAAREIARRRSGTGRLDQFEGFTVTVVPKRVQNKRAHEDQPAVAAPPQLKTQTLASMFPNQRLPTSVKPVAKKKAKADDTKQASLTSFFKPA